MTKPGIIEEPSTSQGGVLDDAATHPKKQWRVGTLTYTQSQLASVFFWLLWGDFCLNIMELVIPRMVPLQLSRLNVSNAVIGILTGSVFSLMNFFMNPVISTWSDRHRGPRGRRIPFMLWPTPPLTAALILVGFSANIAGWVSTVFPGVGAGLVRLFTVILPGLTGLSPMVQLTVAVLAVGLILYRFFDLFPGCVYYYVWADVVPQAVMGKFACLFRVFASAGGFVFHYWILRYAGTHPGAIYIGCALLYLTAFLLLSFLVKEGEYPPPPPKQRHPLAAAWVWARECFTHSYYWKYFAVYACFRWAYVPFNNMLIVYAQKGVGMTDADFGHRTAWAIAIQMPIFFLLGPLVDRHHPTRVGIIGFLAMAVAGTAGFFLTIGPKTFGLWALASFGAIALFQGALVSLGPRLLPRSRYGQFCAATMMVVELGLIALNWVCGKVMDWYGERFIWLWLGGFALLGCVAMTVLYRAWRREGGDDAYVPPGGFDPIAAAEGER